MADQSVGALAYASGVSRQGWLCCRHARVWPGPNIPNSDITWRSAGRGLRLITDSASTWAGSVSEPVEEPTQLHRLFDGEVTELEPRQSCQPACPSARMLG